MSIDNTIILWYYELLESNRFYNLFTAKNHKLVHFPLDIYYFGNVKNLDSFSLELNQGVFRRLTKSNHIKDIPMEIQKNINIQATTKALLKSGENFKKEKKNEPKFSQFDPDNPFRLSFTEDGFKEEHITSALCFNEISTNGQTFKIDKEKENQYFTDFNGMVLFFRIEKLIEIEMQGEKVVHYAKVKFFNTKKNHE